MTEVTEKNVVQSVSEGKFLLMFYTDWCPLCPPIIEILTQLEQTEKGRFQFVKINFDDNPKANEAYAVQGVPMVLAVEDGKVLHGWGGLTDEEAYREILNEFF